VTKIKICGVRRVEDIKSVNKYLPEFVGFVFAPSRRQVDIETVKMLSGNLDKRIKKVGVFVNESGQKVAETAGQCGLDVVQIHGDESPEYINSLRGTLACSPKKVEIWKALRVKDNNSLKIMEMYSADAFLLDAYIEGSYGGAGKVFDWSMAASAGKMGKIILAGGLSRSNVREAIRVLRPYSVDVSSGVESDGWKDETKIREFICTVRNYE